MTQLAELSELTIGEGPLGKNGSKPPLGSALAKVACPWLLPELPGSSEPMFPCIQSARRWCGGINNFNDYYGPTLKRSRQALLECSGVFIVEGDINDMTLLKKLFELMTFTHVLHLAAQAGVRYAMENPLSYMHSNLAGFVSLLEVCKSVNLQPAIVWASSSSVYGLNTKVPFSEKDQTDRPASLYTTTKKLVKKLANLSLPLLSLSCLC